LPCGGLFVVPPPPDVSGVTTITIGADDVDELPWSVATAWRLCVPGAAPLHEICHGLSPRRADHRRAVEEIDPGDRPSRSDATASTRIGVPSLNTAPFRGLISDTVGGWLMIGPPS
jgi:hypothetical protein